MTDANDVVDIAQGELEQLIGQDTGGIGEAKERMVREYGADSHGARVQNGFVAEIAETGVAVDDFNALANHYVAEHGEEGEYSGEGGFAIDYRKWAIVHF